jgi:hypothetical protein
MSTAINATCPGCKKVLKVPTQWVNQVIRCKFCNMAMQIKPNIPQPQSGVKANPTQQSPQSSGNVPQTPSAAVRNGVPPLPDVSPIPSNHRGAQSVTNQFGLTDVNYNPSYSSKYRKKKVNWVIPVLVMAFMGILGIVFLVMAMPYIKDKINNNADSMTAVDGKGKPKDADQIDQNKDGNKGKGPGENKKNNPAAGGSNAPFPRRALVVSVHNYLYANPTQYGLMVQGMKNIPAISKYLTNQMRVPVNQIMHLSDAAKDNPTPPTKSVVESTITDFLKSSRKQDHVMLVFVGHAVENDGQVYLAPIEGDLTDPTSLIPLAWLYKELDSCVAHQKILVLDVCRFSPTIGIERPGGQPMSAKMEEVIKAVPAGLQVITACSAEQRSMETDGELLGVFLDGFVDALQKGVQGHIQKQGDNIPIDNLFEATVKNVEVLAVEQKFKQTPKMYGAFKDNGAEFDPAEPMPPKLAITGLKPVNKEGIALVKSVLEEIGTPPVKASEIDNSIRLEYLPPIADHIIKEYAKVDGPETDLQKNVKKARIELWVISSLPAPADIKNEVDEKRKIAKVNLDVLKDGYRAPANEIAFKTGIEKDEKDVARMFVPLQDALDDLKKNEEMKDAETKRWQANYDFIRARLESQIAYLYEYQSMLGQMRKELPERDAKLHGGWKLAATAKLQGDSAGKKLAKESTKTMEALVKNTAGSPWEVLAKREKFTTLGLEWQGTK